MRRLLCRARHNRKCFVSSKFTHMNTKCWSSEPSRTCVGTLAFQKAVVGEKVQREANFTSQGGERVAAVGAVGVLSKSENVLPGLTHFSTGNFSATFFANFQVFT